MTRFKDDDEDMGEKLVANADFQGPTGNRHCTDILCSLLLLASWVAMTGVGAYSVANGDYRIVLYPLDFDGNICGTTFAADMTNYPYLYYINNYGGGVCMKSCPALEGIVANNNSDVFSMITYGGLFLTNQSQVTAEQIQIADYSSSNDSLTCTLAKCIPSDNPVESWSSEGVSKGYGYAYYVADSYPVVQRCTITAAAATQIDAVTQANTTLSGSSDSTKFWNQLYADMYIAKAYILGFGFGVALLVSFGYIYILRIPFLLSFVIWTSIFLTIAMFTISGYYLYSQANYWDTEVPQVQTDSAISATRWISYVLFIIGAILFLLMCCLRKAIQLAIGCVKEAGKAVTKMPMIMTVPILQATGLIAFLVIWTVYGVYLASLGKIVTQEFPLNLSGLTISVRTWEFDDFTENCGWYLLFCLFWTGNFIVAVGDMVMAMCVAKWYFTRDKSEINSGTVWGSLYDTLLYHLGTCAYGSLILAIVQLIRSILAKIQKEVKKANSSIANTLLCCCQCCLWCFEQCIRFLNKNAYIQTAIFGTSFCKSAREAFFLILRNIGRIGAITYVSGAILIVGKFFISSVTTGFSYYAMNELIGDELYSIAGPTVLVFIISYFVSDMFLDVFDMGISTVLQCFVADEEMFDGDECFAEGDLKRWIDNYED